MTMTQYKGEIIMSETKKNITGQRSTAASRSSASHPGGTRNTAASGRSSSQKSSADRVAAVKNARNSGSTTTTRRSTGTNRRRKYRRQSPDFAKLLLIAIGIVIAVLCVAVGLKGCGKEGDDPTKEAAAATTAAPETEIHAEITVNGISVNGLTKSEAMEKILADLGWDMKVAYNGDAKPIENLMTYNVDKVLEEALGKGDSGSYDVGTDGLDDYVNAAVAVLADGWDVRPKNGSISSYDKSSGEFKFAGAENGKLIEREALASNILAAIKAGEYDKTIEATAKEVQPEITEAQAKESFKRLGTYTTTTTNNKARNENVRIASEAINGMIIQPGEEFSFNRTTGNRTPEKGYKPAGAYVNGVLVEEPGGGVCQVSSTLYNAVVFSGLKTTERHAHSYEPSYVTPGEDAMVSYDGFNGPDMKFINNSKTAVGIKTSFSNQKLTVSVYGSPILEEGVTLSMVSTKVKELDPPAPVYEEDQTLEPGVEVEAKAATMGSRWATSLVTKKNGVVISEEHFHNSTYKGKSATIRRNTSGVVIPAEGQSSEGTVNTESAAENGGNGTTEPTAGSAAGPAGDTQTRESTLGNHTQPTGDAQNVGPGEVIKPSSGTGDSANGPGGTMTPGGTTTPGSTSTPTTAPQSPADMTSPANGPGTTPPQNFTQTTTSGPGGQSAEAGAGPGNVGLIAPIG